MEPWASELSQNGGEAWPKIQGGESMSVARHPNADRRYRACVRVTRESPETLAEMEGR